MTSQEYLERYCQVEDTARTSERVISIIAARYEVIVEFPTRLLCLQRQSQRTLNFWFCAIVLA